MNENFFKGEFGLEKESLRVNKYGFLPKTKHPFPDHPNIERDFCENQVEIITDVFYSISEVYQQLLDIQQFVLKKLAGLKTEPEFLWPFSNPPYIKSEDDIHIATYSGDKKAKEEYRKYLAKKYGKRKMLFSGIHFNFSFDSNYIESQFKLSSYESFFEYKNQLYLDIAKKVTKYAWLLVYLTSASSVADGSLINDEDIGKDITEKYSSFRCSEIGYWNSFVPVLNYNSLKDYINSIHGYIQNKQLKSPSELYYPVRLKTKGENNLDRLLVNGINHIELRMFDLNPLDPAGIKKIDLTFLHYFILYLSQLPEIDFPKDEQLVAIENEKNAAKYHSDDIWIKEKENNIPVKEAAAEFLTNMKNFYKGKNRLDILECIDFQLDKVLEPDHRYCAIINKYYGHDYVHAGIVQMKKYTREAEENLNV